MLKFSKFLFLIFLLIGTISITTSCNSANRRVQAKSPCVATKGGVCDRYPVNETMYRIYMA